MKLPFFSARVFTVALLCLGCGGDDSQRSTSAPAPSVSSRLDNPTASSNRALAAFRSVDLQAGCRVTLRKGATHNAALEGPSELLQGLELIAQPNGQLLIRMLEEYDNRNFDKVSITLYTPGPVSGLAISGSGHLTVQDSFDGIETMSVSGSGTIQTATSLRTDRLTTSLAGSGNIAAYTLQADKLDCSIAGSGNISINVSNKIDANIAGSGSLFYKGNPIVEQNITGSGQITKQ